jgi:hypothetical protein
MSFEGRYARKSTDQSVSIVAIGALSAPVPALVQEVMGVPSSPSATTTIEGMRSG